MGAVTIKSTSITNADQSYPRVLTNPWITKGPLFCAAGTCEVGVADSVGSQYRFARIPSGARIHRMDIFSDAITGFAQASVGVYAVQDTAGNAGGVVSAGLFGTGVDFRDAQTEPYDVIFNNLDIVKVEQRVWELLGLTADPMVSYDITITSVTQSGGAGSLAMRLEYTV